MASKEFLQQKSPMGEQAMSADPEKKNQDIFAENVTRNRALNGLFLPVPLGFLRPC